MDLQKKTFPKLTTRQKIIITGVTCLFAAVGALLGIIAYQQKWLG